MNLLRTPSILQKFTWENRDFYIKRDDLLHPFINGNKARKFKELLKLDTKAKALISYGGNQSNAMLTLSHIAKQKNCPFIYITPPLSEVLRNSPQGNFALALENGTKFEFYKPSGQRCDVNALKNRALQICEGLQTPKNLQTREDLQICEDLQMHGISEGVFIPQGGACELSKTGIKELALELIEDTKNLKNPAFFYVSGSGASAGYLSEFLPCVFTTAAAGSKEYLLQSFKALKIQNPPMVLEISSKIPFGKPDLRLLEIYQQWLGLGVSFDLIYDVLGWLCIRENLSYFDRRDVVFIHSGGLSGNITQIQRYKNKKMIP